MEYNIGHIGQFPKILEVFDMWDLCINKLSPFLKAPLNNQLDYIHKSFPDKTNKTKSIFHIHYSPSNTFIAWMSRIGKLVRLGLGDPKLGAVQLSVMAYPYKIWLSLRQTWWNLYEARRLLLIFLQMACLTPRHSLPYEEF